MNTQIQRPHCQRELSLRRDSPWRNDRWRHRDEFTSTAKDFDVTFSSVLENAAQDFHCIAIDPGILGGTPRIQGTRIPIYMILDAIEHYGDLPGALKSYPHLSLGQVREAVCFAAQVLEHAVDYES
jgi:uncharacterized protein (DUF433 family)